MSLLLIREKKSYQKNLTSYIYTQIWATALKLMKHNIQPL